MTRRPLTRARILLGALAAVLLLALSAGAGSASASSAGWWLLETSFAPTKVTPGKNAQISVTAVNAGYQDISAASKPIVITDTVPAGLKLVAHSFPKEPAAFALAGPYQPGIKKKPVLQMPCTIVAQTVTCELAEQALRPNETIRLTLNVEPESSLETGTVLENKFHIEGGKTTEGAEPPHVTEAKTTEVSEEATKAGVGRYELRPENADGTIDTQAGSHPFQLTTIFSENEVLKLSSGLTGSRLSPYVPALPKNLHFVLPPA